MTLGVLLAHVAARWAATRTPTCGWVPDESEIEMNSDPTIIYTPTPEVRVFSTPTLIDLMRPHALTCDVRLATNDQGKVTEIRTYCGIDHVDAEGVEA